MTTERLKDPRPPSGVISQCEAWLCSSSHGKRAEIRSITKRPREGARRSFSAILALFLLTACCAPAHADRKSDARKPYALLFGTVYNSANHPVYGVKIKIRRADKKHAKWELYSDHAGEFAQRVPAGKADYVVSTEAKKGQPSAETTIHIDADERKDFSLILK